MKHKDAYDLIVEMRTECFPTFEHNQHDASEKILGALDDIEFETMWDLGCGTGEILISFAKRWPERKFIGVDRSSLSLDAARANQSGLSNIRFQQGGMDNVRAGKNDAVLCVGNTMIHFGASRLRAWLQKAKQLPKYIFLDFIDGWDKVISNGTTFQVQEFGCRGESVHMSGLNTTLVGGKVIRQLIHLDAVEGKSPKVEMATVLQSADTVGCYEAVLQDMGYIVTSRVSYTHGYGSMGAALWTRQ